MRDLERQKEWRKANRERERELERKRYAEMDEGTRALKQEQHKEWLEKNKEHVKDYDKKRYQDPKVKEYMKAWREKNRESINAKRRAFRATPAGKAQMRKYNIEGAGITVEQYDAAFAAQGGVCAICKKPPRKGSKRLHVDHDHKTMVFRGLLCNKCNTAIGLCNDDPTIFERMVKFLEQERTIKVRAMAKNTSKRIVKKADGVTDPVTVS